MLQSDWYKDVNTTHRLKMECGKLGSHQESNPGCWLELQCSNH